ncbi:MAG: hypothetical protein KDD36_14165 [Flavobacteriales bacterium]|nr:hypothetical protein [Flavobacteriales bacterium]
MQKNRRDFLKLTGLVGAASLVPFGKVLAGSHQIQRADACTLIPTETAGPFPLDLTANTNFFRQDVRESKAGVQLNQKLRILGDSNCQPMPNVRVNIWHCDRDGYYSGYDQSNNPGQAGLTYLRGYQMTDANGEVEFITIFPGWYGGRVCHIHFQVYVNSSYAAISQLTYDQTEKQAIYTANPSIYTKGVDPLTPGADGIFADGYTYQLATLTPNSTTGGYDSYLEVTVKGTGTTPTGYLERENAKHFMLGQNQPNPYTAQTTIPVYLTRPSDVTLDIYDLQGKRVSRIKRDGLAAGDHTIELNMHNLGLPIANYLYQIEVKNEAGIFRDCKMMTAGR